ncbi:MAG: hypothetical protein GY881_13735 [Gammaproteobacteria bacterium]|jgi:hypothetical protein|nr:hypothetical protein [Gammaproteobacteria bacterium]MCP4880121.1 hypothetical protein [Gammaproteobacteria bacterium]MDP6164715.1 hypothetical protein [Gammaproteobacteria bacterium]
MNYLAEDFGKRFGIVLMITVIVGLAMWGFEFTEYAIDINENGFSGDHHGEGEREGGEAPEGMSALRYFMPLVKISLMTLIPAAIWVWVSKLINRKKAA